MTSIVILDYGAGNIGSVRRALARVGADVDVSADMDAVLNADGVVVPGVGAYASCMAGLERVYGPRLIERRLAGARPVLGICVGLQVMFEAGTEHGVRTEGLAQWPGEVSELCAPVLPHMGWTAVRAHPESRLLAGMDGERFYFVHSYAAHTDPATLLGETRTRKPVTSFAYHGEDFVAAVENGPLSAVQFHPEKSADAGLELLSRWVQDVANA